MRVKIEMPAFPDAPYRTTLVALKGDLKILIEAQGSLNYHSALRQLSALLAARREYAELWISVMDDSGAQAVGMLSDLRRDGVGLMVVSKSGEVNSICNPVNPALAVNCDPNLKLGDCKAEINTALSKFNRTNRKDGLRDLCELVERVTAELGEKAIRRSMLIIDLAAWQHMDFSDQINALNSPKCHPLKATPLFTESFKHDMHSFRGARNLIDHKAKNKWEDAKRQKQFSERMLQGPRLVADLLSIGRRIK